MQPAALHCGAKPRALARTKLCAELEQHSAGCTLVCETCRRVFTSGRRQAYDSHVSSCVPKPPRKAVSAQIVDRIGVRGAKEREEFTSISLNHVAVPFESLAQFTTELTFDVVPEVLPGGPAPASPQKITVSTVDSTRLLVCTFVERGSTLVEFKGTLDALSAADFPREMTFRPSPPPVPVKGWSRKGARDAAMVLDDAQ